jgi:hypothetical protein
MGLFILWCVVFLPNFREAREAARARQEQIRALDEDVNRGIPPSVLAEWHAEVLTGSDPLMIGYLPEGMRQLQRIGNPHFRGLQDPPFEEIAVPVAPVVLNQIAWENGVAHGQAQDANMTFSLGRPRRVLAIRLTYAYELPPDGSATFRMFWKQSGVNEFADTERTITTGMKPPARGQPHERTLTVWVNDSIDELLLHPDDKPYVFHLWKIVLLVPPGEATAPETEPKS